MEEDNPLFIENIKEKQDEDNDLWQTATKHPEWYSRKTFDQITDVLCYTKPGENPSTWKIALPKKLIKPTIKWYHQVTGHPGSKWLYEQIHQRYHNQDLRRYIDNFNCDYCQRNNDVAHANVGQNVTPHNPSLGLCLYPFLHKMSLWHHDSIHDNTNNQQTPPPWWWSRLHLQRHGFDESTPSLWWVALRMFVPMLLSKDFVWFIKLL